MKLSSNLSHPIMSQAGALRLIYNTAFALWLFLIAGATLSLVRQTLTEAQLLVGGFLLLAFTFLAGLLLLVLHLMIGTTQTPPQSA